MPYYKHVTHAASAIASFALADEDAKKAAAAAFQEQRIHYLLIYARIACDERPAGQAKPSPPQHKN
jgi:hypothetical protein